MILMCEYVKINLGLSWINKVLMLHLVERAALNVSVTQAAAYCTFPHDGDAALHRVAKVFVD